MKKYAKVEGQKIIYKGFLPKSWEGIEDFNKLTDEELASYGFYEAIDVLPESPLMPYEYYDRPVIEFSDNKYYFVVEKVPHDVEWLEHAIAIGFNRLKKLRDQLIISTDWTQLPDAELSESEVDEYKTYRKLIRDKFDEMESEIDDENLTLEEKLVTLTECDFAHEFLEE